MAEVKTACSSCAKNDVCRHMEIVEQIKKEFEEKEFKEALDISINCKYAVKILKPAIGYRGC